ncbi:MAG TPA: type II toxin-antitoxin system RelE/ParE family toxin [Devosia sp.]
MAWRTTDRADEDIAEIEIYGTLTFGRRSAEEYVDDLFAAFDLLAASPRIVPERSELPGSPRLYPFRSHYIVFELVDEDILVRRVLHVRRDITGHL